MSVAIDNIKWSETGKRVDFSVEVFTGSEFWGDKTKSLSWKCFVLGSKEGLTRYFERENELAKIVYDSRSSWLGNVGNRYYSIITEEGLTIRVWKKSYTEYE